MTYEFAPMEGITGFVFRNAHRRYFPSMDRYYTPFLTPKQGRGFTSREKRDVAPEHNRGVPVIPQVLTNSPEGFLKAAHWLESLGYGEINLNLGCPSKTVVTKRKGAGFLAFPEELDAFLERIFAGTKLEISVKTRIGVEDPEEFGRLLEIFNGYPIKELIVHPRLQADYYRNSPDLEAFGRAVRESETPLCYNGDLFSQRRIDEVCARFPEVDRLMLGRGLLVDPGLVEKRKTGKRTDPKALWAFHETLLEGYSRELSGEKDVLFKMKELWFYMIHLFSGGEYFEKKIKKYSTVAEYRLWVERLINECPILPRADVSFLRRG